MTATPRPVRLADRRASRRTGKIKRSDFGFTHLVPMVGDDVDLLIEVEFNPKK